jgi:Protein of unknown function (DUF3443)
MRRNTVRGFLALTLIAVVGSVVGCGSGSRSNPPPPPGSNVQPIIVNAGPAGASLGSNFNSVNVAFTSVTLCVPGSTTKCQTIDGILVDTGSTGFRVLSSALTLTLPQQTDSNNPIAECFPFVSSTVWGSVRTADLTITGEAASSLPIQVIGDPNFPTIPSACTNIDGPPQDDLASFGANGIIGIGVFGQDCGGGCAISGASNPGLYYTCPPTGCVVTAESLAEQLQNPIILFAGDNNGSLIVLPSVSAPEATVSGSLIFGIGTRSNNGLGSATVLTVDPSFGNFSTTFNGQTFTDAGFIDSGSAAIFFLDSGTTGIPDCADPFFYCPPSIIKNLMATNVGTNGANAPVSFDVDNADSLLSNVNNSAVPNLAGTFSGNFDYGLPFFFGRTVFTAIEGKNTPGGAGPYQAY